MRMLSNGKWLRRIYLAILILRRSALNFIFAIGNLLPKTRSTPTGNTRDAYRALCETEKSIPLFSQAWWLDAAAGEGNWDVALVERENRIVAAMPYVVETRYGFKLLTQPPLTQALGPWLKHDAAANPVAPGEVDDSMLGLIDQLPRFDHFTQNWHYSNSNGLPFQWRGFQQSTRYTYIIADTSNHEQVMANLEHSKLKNIKKAREIVSVEFDLPAEEFYENHKMTLAKQGKEIAYSKSTFTSLYNAAYRRESGRTIAAFDQHRNLHCALFVVWDHTSAYDLISTIDPEFRIFGAASLLVVEAIKFTSKHTSKFDFEGSMIEGVERSFRQFGAIQTPYASLSKTPSILLRTFLFFKDLKRGA